jgi:hypothetical protein
MTDEPKPEPAEASLALPPSILERIGENFAKCQELQQQAVALRRQSRALRESLPSLASEAEQVRATNEAEMLMHRACAIEERMPDLMAGVGELLVAQVKELAEQPAEPDPGASDEPGSS